MKKILLSIFVSLIFISEVFAVPNYKQEIDISDDTEGLRGINFKPDGTIMYITRRINIGSLEGDASRVGFINQYSQRERGRERGENVKRVEKRVREREIW